MPETRLSDSNFLQAEMKKEIFEGKVAAKLAILEEILKSNSDGKGYFVGNGVSHFDSVF